MYAQKLQSGTQMIPVKRPASGVVAKGVGRGYLSHPGPYHSDLDIGAEPRHGVQGWELAKYEWRNGLGRFLYVRDNGGGKVERREVYRQQTDWCV